MPIVLLEPVRVELRLNRGTQVRSPKLVAALRRAGAAHVDVTEEPPAATAPTQRPN